MKTFSSSGTMYYVFYYAYNKSIGFRKNIFIIDMSKSL